MKKLFTITAFLFCFWPHRGFTADLIFIVNAENPVEKITAAELRNFYFKKKTQWPDGSSVRFIDRNVGSSAKKLFLKNYIKKSLDEVETYWIGQKLYSGESAPLQENSDQMTIRFVAAFKGAIGYVTSLEDVPPKEIKPIVVDSKKDD